MAQCAITGTVLVVPMPTAVATILPPPYCSASDVEEGGSVRHLEEVGVGRVLGAMIEQRHRRTSQPSYPAISEADGALQCQPESDALTRRPGSCSDVFLKAR